MAKHKMHIGGQAVIEGVMMMGAKYINISVRKKSKIVSKKLKLKKKPKWTKLLFIRGIFNLIAMMVIGIKALMWSANETAETEDEKLSKKELSLSLIIAVVVSVFLFILFPLYLTKFFTKSNGILFNLIDGIIRVAFFLIYLFGISLMNDVKIMFQYHGAEHKAVNCFEDKKKLTIENIKKYSTLHPRCGTAFLIIVLIISIFIFSLITSPNWLVKFLGRIVLIPVIAGISYELLKLSARFKDNWFFKVMIKPGLWFQKITTKEPTKKQIEVAMVSLKKVLALEKV